jgi:hypothetical protein
MKRQPKTRSDLIKTQPCVSVRASVELPWQVEMHPPSSLKPAKWNPRDGMRFESVRSRNFITATVSLAGSLRHATSLMLPTISRSLSAAAGGKAHTCRYPTMERATPQCRL